MIVTVWDAVTMNKRHVGGAAIPLSKWLPAFDKIVKGLGPVDSCQCTICL